MESHGVVDNMAYDPKYNRVLDFHNPEFWNFENASMPLWTLNELAGNGRRSGVMMWPGSPFPFGENDTLPSRIVPWNHNVTFETRIDTVVDWITSETDPVNLVFLYFQEPDEIAHGYGPESPQVTQYISTVDNTTGYLISKLKYFGIYERVNLILLSDHGFQEVHQRNMINYTSLLTPETYQAFGYSPVIHILPKNGQLLEEIYSTLEKFSRNKNFTVFKKEELDPLWHYSHNRRIMPIVLVADLGYVFDDFQETIHMYNQKFNITRK